LRELRDRLAHEAHLSLQALRTRWLWLYMLISVVAIGLAYQVKLPYRVSIGVSDDCPYLGNTLRCPLIDGWNAIETDKASGTRYRWSTGASPIQFLGIGNQPLTVRLRLSGARPNQPPPQVKIEVEGRRYFVQSAAEFKDLELTLPRQTGLNGDLKLFLYPPSFSLPRDSRELGVRVTSVEIAPADYGLTSLVIPDPLVAVSLLTALLIIWLISYRAFGIIRAALACAGVCLLICVLALSFDRLAISGFAPQLAVVMLWSLGLVAIILLFFPRRWAGERAVGLLAGIAAFAFALRFGGMVYPQFISIDLNFHAQHLEQMLQFFQGQGDNFYFQSKLPNGTPVPYPSAYYVLLTPLSWLLGGNRERDQLLLRFASALLDTAIVLALYRFALRFGRDVALYAAALYAVGPAVFDLLSAGAHTNIFAQAMFVAALACALGALSRAHGEARYRRWLVAYFLFMLLTLLGHYGTAIAALLVVGAVGLVWLLFAPASLQGRIWPLWGATAGATLLSFLLYYVHYLDQMSLQIQNILSGGKLYHSAQFSFGFKLPDLLADLLKWQGWVILPLAVLGASCQFFGRETEVEETEDGRTEARLLLIGWSAAGVLLAATGLVDRYTVRYNMILMPLLCVWAAIALSWLARRSKPAAGAALGLAAMYTVALWVGVVLTGYH
jgi:hypothetical protein